tara:strand:+ start:7037 stop:7999 length:963 start_codon:yes stop_codon:yes gene_type:complete
MQLIEGVSLSELCDYSFGDQSGQWGNIFTSFMKDANLLNLEFVEKVFEVKKSRDYMTLFIDNIRLYKRHIVKVKESDRSYIEGLMEKSDLLKLCSEFPDMRFIIFTNLEDTPIDDYIFDLIPKNVICISAVNALSHGGKVIPAPYGLQRKMNPGDNRIEDIASYMEHLPKNPPGLLYVSHSESTNSERMGIKDLFKGKSWAEVHDKRVSYSVFLYNLSQSKFMICPVGNAIDCHRNWEVILMRRVPIMKRHPYLEVLYKQYPVLFVDDYSEVTEELLISKSYLFEKMQKIDLSDLNVKNFYSKVVEEVTSANELLMHIVL